jgi:hypothetical protein
MGYQAEFKGWNSLSIFDLLVAYRKAKADCFFENSFPTAINFAKYEQDLIANLKKLLSNLKKNSGFENDKTLLGTCRLLPKKLVTSKSKSAESGHAHFSDPDRAFKYLCKNNESLIPEFRIVGDFPVEAHIISALWINMIGHKFDACLENKHVYGARLRRVRNDDNLDRKVPKDFHITAVGSFEPYFQPYKNWRKDGLTAIRRELEEDRSVVAASLDLKSFYHRLDPKFLSLPTFLKEIGIFENLSEKEQDFNSQLSSMLHNWSNLATRFSKGLQTGKKEAVTGGLAIGLTASRVIANVLLHRWDKLIHEKLAPVHYGRYVDDMFLVLHDPGANVISNTNSFLKFLSDRLGENSRQTDGLVIRSGEKATEPWQINLGKNYQAQSKIELQADKQKLFILEGQGGCDLLDSIEKEIGELSSEHRLMPSPDQLEQSTAAKVLSASENAGDAADTLRRADGLTIRRLSWAIQMRHVETLAHDLPKNQWKKQREEFYAFAHNHILRPDRIFSHYQYLPRLLGFAVGLGDWVQAEKIVSKSLDAFDTLKENSSTQAVINGFRCEIKMETWLNPKGSLTWAFIDAAARYYPVNLIGNETPEKPVKKLSNIFLNQLLERFDPLQRALEILNWPWDNESFYEMAPLLAKSDLAKTSYSDLCSMSFNQLPLDSKTEKMQKAIEKEFSKFDFVDCKSLAEFLKATQRRRFNIRKDYEHTQEKVSPFFFPTRPFSPARIAELVPSCVGIGKKENYPANLWAKYVRALRGVWVTPSLLLSQDAVIKDAPKSTDKGPPQDGPPIVLNLGSKKQRKVIVAITNFATEDSSWSATACNKPDLTLERYSRLSNLINQALQINPRPQYLILPELSLPLKWVDSIANRLQGSHINLIAGTEYRHSTSKTIYSEACLVLSDDRLGYPSFVKIWQPKLQPAVGEDQNLIHKFGKKWREKFPAHQMHKPIYNHHGFHFGVMVCSELQNSKARIAFQGQVDALAVLAWNQDLDTFSSLVESCALDVHAYTILVNNRNYGDSRVRSPAKKDFLRDIARLRGGKNDFCVTVELDIEELRAFQSRAKRWPNVTDQFKPVPEGFHLLESRRHFPPR